jgi:formate/nitrite transporter FocA (FNT family)|tara:strand:- start:329 stop:493 length:165 start_codon:yes stop_codon:yes gene_type:complete
MSDTKLISGTAAAVIIGFGAIIYAILGNESFGIRVIIFILGCMFTWLGLRFSKG